jgi:TBC1 domain family member 2
MSSRGLPGFLRRSLRPQFDEDDRGGQDNDLSSSSSSSSDGVVDRFAKLSHTADDSQSTPLQDRWTDTRTTVSTVETDTTLTPPTQSSTINTENGNNAMTSSRAPPAAAAATATTIDKPQSTLSREPSIPQSALFTGNTPTNTAQRRVKPALSDSWQALPDTKIPTVADQTPPKSYKLTQFERVLNASIVNLEDLRKIAWNGIPPRHRALVWKLLLGYLPLHAQRRTTTVQRKRAEYAEAMAQHYSIPDDRHRSLQEQETLRQVLVDVPRTQPTIALFRHEAIRRMLGRLLFVWAMRHPASSYVQGINDLATPLIVVFLADYYDSDPANLQDGHVLNHISPERLLEVEADVYGCLTNLLANIQDHYTADQPGLQRMVMRLQELVQRIDADLCHHLQETGVEFIQFSFKWMNCLLLREFQLPGVIRLWDTYLSEKNGYEDFHVYVCAAFLCQFSAPLQQMSFDEIFVFFQNIPTQEWTDTEIEMLLSQAYVLSTLFAGSDAHLTSHSGARR